jgi:hypothetical protein
MADYYLWMKKAWPRIPANAHEGSSENQKNNKIFFGTGNYPRKSAVTVPEYRKCIRKLNKETEDTGSQIGECFEKVSELIFSELKIN